MLPTPHPWAAALFPAHKCEFSGSLLPPLVSPPHPTAPWSSLPPALPWVSPANHSLSLRSLTPGVSAVLPSSLGPRGLPLPLVSPRDLSPTCRDAPLPSPQHCPNWGPWNAVPRCPLGKHCAQYSSVWFSSSFKTIDMSELLVD